MSFKNHIKPSSYRDCDQPCEKIHDLVCGGKDHAREQDRRRVQTQARDRDLDHENTRDRALG
jgi:hypothetical protein